MRRPIRGTPTRRSIERARGHRISGWRRDAPPTTNSEEGTPEGASAIEAAARGRCVPLKILRLEPPHGLYRRKLVLIRPDQHIAWHGDAAADATAVIDRVRGA